MHKRYQTGFTIVELLIVIVVIGILASISVVAYRGMQNRAHDIAVQSDVRHFSQKLTLFQIDNGRYPTSADELQSLGVNASTRSYVEQDNALVYTVGAWGTNHVRLAGLSQSGNAYGVVETAGVYGADGSTELSLTIGSVGQIDVSWTQGLAAFALNSILGGSCTVDVHIFVSQNGTDWTDLGDGNRCVF